MDLPHLVALVIFVSYFLTIIGVFTLILRSLKTLAPHQNRYSKLCWTVAFLALVSLGHTWFHMFKFLAWSFDAYEASLSGRPTEGLSSVIRLTAWLLNTSLFEQAWAAVSFGPMNWWWSQQLCLYTVGGWTAFLATKGRAYGVPHLWAYMLLGQLVAISVASNLFYLAVLLSAARQEPKKHDFKKSQWRVSVAPPTYVPILFSLGSIFYSPYTSVANGSFIINLLLMHTLIFIPLIIPPVSVPLLPNVRLSAFSIFISSLSGSLHLRDTLRASYILSHGLLNIPTTVRLFVEHMWTTLQWHHPAQSSIGWDVVWTTISMMLWVLFDVPDEYKTLPSNITRSLAFIATPLVSVGGTAPIVFGLPAAVGQQAIDVKSK